MDLFDLSFDVRPTRITSGRQTAVADLGESRTAIVTDDAADSLAEHLRLDHFLKLAAGSETGGQAKLLIQSGEVKVNGEVETRRRRKLVVGDVVEFGGRSYPVEEIPRAN